MLAQHGLDCAVLLDHNVVHSFGLFSAITDPRLGRFAGLQDKGGKGSLMLGQARSGGALQS